MHYPDDSEIKGLIFDGQISTHFALRAAVSEIVKILNKFEK